MREFNTPLNETIENDILEQGSADSELPVSQATATSPIPMAMDAVIAPGIAHTSVISQVEGLPITIRSIPSQTPAVNTVQTIANNMRIQALQREVLELREMLTRLMTEVAKHAELLGGRTPIDLLRSQEQYDSLRHSYVSNFDFSPPRARATTDSPPKLDAPSILVVPSRPQYSVITWVAATASLAALAYLGVSMATGMFWGQEPIGRTVYYLNSEPEVAGAESPAVPPPAPSNEPVTGDSPLNVLQ